MKSLLSVGEQKLLGLLFILPFPLYGVGQSLLLKGLNESDPQFPVWAGLLILLNSVDVLLIAWLFKRRLSNLALPVKFYLFARAIEAVLLFTPVVLWPFVKGQSLIEIQLLCYLAGMLAVSIGSVFFFLQLKRIDVLRGWLCSWAVFGYSLLGLGCLFDLLMHTQFNVMLALPGGLFELFFGFGLLFFVRFLQPTTDSTQ